MADEQFLIRGFGGKKKLRGTIRVSGAKNAALKVMASAVLFRDGVTLKNVPEIEDVKRMSDLLVDLGCTVTHSKEHTYTIQCHTKARTDLSGEISKRMRSSIVLSGPLLGRFGSVSFPHPGGCVIGERPIDFFINGFKKMGATVMIAGGARKKRYILKAKNGKLRGADIFLRNPSVTATETFMMAGVLAYGVTKIENAAIEPEIKDLADFLVRGGARISGAGTSTIIVRGNGLLRARATYTTMPDRIEAGSFIILGALCAKHLVVKDCEPKHLASLLYVLEAAGVTLTVKKNAVIISNGHHAGKKFKILNIKTHEYPGFPTDLQALITVFLTQTKGEAIVFETIFEGRLNYTESLASMGADITPMDSHRVLVKGPTVLYGKKLQSPDLRAGLAFIIAAIIARGTSTIDSIYNIDRGYEQIEARLQKIGVVISRIEKRR